MLTIALDKTAKQPLYLQIYRYIKKEILAHRLQAHQQLPSKRALAAQLGISAITVENAYAQLISEGYLYTKEKSGYYVVPLSDTIAEPAGISQDIPQDMPCEIQPAGMIDLASNSTQPESFPFSIWSKLMRYTMSHRQQELLQKSPPAGIMPLRHAIAAHLASFRGMAVNPADIIVGAGTEYLYQLLIKLLGRQRIFCLEDPGYPKLAKIYRDGGAHCVSLPIDSSGVSLHALQQTSGNVLHISPSHQFPTGIITPVSRRYEILTWASSGDRYIIEDDYDTEFRLTGSPIPSLYSMDTQGKVIYMNTFSKSLIPTIRISYMVLPQQLREAFHQRLSYLSNTVSVFEQYTLATFIQEGYFERHINRMRTGYKKIKQQFLRALTEHPHHEKIKVIRYSSGLYFLLEIKTPLSDSEVEAALAAKGIRLQALRHFYQHPAEAASHIFVVNYSSIRSADIPRIVQALYSVCS